MSKKVQKTLPKQTGKDKKKLQKKASSSLVQRAKKYILHDLAPTIRRLSYE